MDVEGKAPLEAYLTEVRRGLAGLSPEETAEVVRELRSHVLDRVGDDASPVQMGVALAALGDPRELARLNLASRIAARGANGRDPWKLLRLTAGVARLSLGGMTAFVLSLSGYLFAAAWLVVVVAKPLAPGHVGLWLPTESADTYFLVLGVTDASPRGTDLLGWWIMPVGLAIGLTAAWLTYRYSRWSLRRLARPVTSLRTA